MKILMHRTFCFLLLMMTVLLPVSTSAETISEEDFEISLSDFVVQGVPTTLTVTLVNDSLQEAWHGYVVEAMVNGEMMMLDFRSGKAEIPVVFDRNEPFSFKIGHTAFVRDMTPMPLWLSVFPPLIAIVLALVFKEVIVSLFLGILFGAGCVGYYGTGWSGLFGGFFRVIDTYIIGALNTWEHLAVILFSLFIGGIVALVSRNGGMMGVLNKLARFATNARTGQLTTWAMGIALFFDDYANSLVVGNTLRPVTDRLNISREKLAYIVDSTAAPMAAVALITTWIGAQLGYIDSGLAVINTPDPQIKMGAYGVMVNSLAYAFYPFLTIIFILILIQTRRDYGPMLEAEQIARAGNPTRSAVENGDHADLSAMQPKEGTKFNAVNAILPIVVLIVGTVSGLLVTGWDAEIWAGHDNGFFRKLALTVGASDSYKALLWSSIAGLTVAIFMSVSQKLLTITESIDTVFAGFKTMISAVAILVLAWSLAAITEQMHSAEFLTGIITGNVPYWLIPALTFILASLVAFSTGSSWGTMAILYPLMLPLCWTVCEAAGCDLTTTQQIFFHVVSAVLAGSVLGDHCSPISDTTILSSLATSTDHIAHVNTQLPYALTVGIVCIALAIVSAYFGINGLWLMPVGALLLYVIVRMVGTVVEETPDGRG